MINAHTLRALAVAAHCDPRTAARWLGGVSVAPMVAARLEPAAASLGIVRAPAALAITSADPMLGITSFGRTVA